MNVATCSKCRKAPADWILRTSALCMSCLVAAAAAGVPKAEALVSRIYNRAAKARKKEEAR